MKKIVSHFLFAISMMTGCAAWLISPRVIAEEITFEEWARLGLYGEGEHQSADLKEISNIQFLTNSGFAGGTSNRYNGTNTDLGVSAWVATLGENTGIEVGLEGNTYTRTDGYMKSGISVLHENGWVGGFTHQYNLSSVDLGKQA